MRLAYPLFLLFLLLVPVLLFLRYYKKRRPWVSYSNTQILRSLPTSWAMAASNVLPILYALGLIFLILSIARPQTGMKQSRVITEAVDIVLTVDVSTSMRAEDFATITQQHLNRLDASKEVLREFIKERKSDRIAMVAFAALPYTVSPLTLDHGWLILRMDELKTGMLEDGTAIGDALASSINRLRDSKAESKVIVLLTDGVNNAGALSPENAAHAAKALGIKIYTVGAGSSGIVRIPVQDAWGGMQYIRQQSEIDEQTLINIANITDATFFRATDLKELKKVYEEIDAMEKTDVEVEQYTRYEERFLPFLILAMLLLLIEKGLSATRLGRLL